MPIKKNRSLEFSEDFFNLLEIKMIMDYCTLNCSLNVFEYNHIQGYVCHLTNDNELNDNEGTVIYCCETIDNDFMVLVTEANCKLEDNLDIIKNAKHYNKINKNYAVRKTSVILNNIYRKDFNIHNSFIFNMHYSLNQIERIISDCESLSYEDYYDLASLEFKDSKYSCDLIIFDGKTQLRYSKVSETEDDDYDNLTMEEVEVKTDSNIVLLEQMMSHLEKYINDDIEYEIKINKETREI